MSSLRNAVNRRTHRERAQPLERQRLGLLEKHKDYSLRAAEFNRKKKTLRNLRAKAAERNEDEFYFGMMSRTMSTAKKTKGTVNGDRGNRALDMDTVRVLKTQDMGFLRTARNTAAKEVRGLEERVIGLGADPTKIGGAADSDDEDDEWDDEGPSRKRARKVVFLDGMEERDEKLAGVADSGDEDEDEEEDADKEVEVAEKSVENPEKLRAEQRQLLLLKLQRRLANARKKLKALATAENELEMQRAKMAKTPTVGGVTKAGKKFKVRERKR